MTRLRKTSEFLPDNKHHHRPDVRRLVSALPAIPPLTTLLGRRRRRGYMLLRRRRRLESKKSRSLLFLDRFLRADFINAEMKEAMASTKCVK